MRKVGFNMKLALVSRSTTLAPAVSLGIGFKLYETQYFGVMAHAAYVNLARASAECNCTSDENYNLQTKSERAPNGPMAYFTGSGNAQGISLTLEPYLHYAGWHVGVAGGLFLFRPQWNEFVQAYDNGTSAQSYVTPHTSNALRIGRTIGVNVQRGNFGVSFAYYTLPTRYTATQYPALYKSASVLMLTYHY
jgi:hypothetical protein